MVIRLIFLHHYLPMSNTLMKKHEVWYDKDYGTSGSSSLVAGIAATFISENPDIKFNITSMPTYLTKIGMKDIIADTHGSSNVFINVLFIPLLKNILVWTKFRKQKM